MIGPRALSIRLSTLTGRDVASDASAGEGRPTDDRLSTVDSYVRTVGRRLRGPVGTRRELMRELADGLDDATEAHVRSGLPVAAAQARAVRECGPVDALVAAYQPELAASQGRRTSMLLALLMPGLVLLWDVPWMFAGAWNAPAPRAVLVLSDVITYTGLAAGGCALLALAFFVAGARLRWSVAKLTGAVGLLGVVVLALTLTCSAAMAVLNPGDTVAVFAWSWIGLLVEAVTIVATGSMTLSLIRSLRLAFGRVPAEGVRSASAVAP
ncbi:permease prefix domain 1-containing protein [Actinopolymorpha pittospori]